MWSLGLHLQRLRNNHGSARKPGCVRSHERFGFCAHAARVQPRFVVAGSAGLCGSHGGRFSGDGKFTNDSIKDVVFAAKGGGLYLMKGNAAGGLGEAKQIELPGAVTALAAGEFRAADGITDLAVGVSGPGGNALMIFDAADGLSNALAQYQLSQPASGIELGGLDDDPFQDVAVAAGDGVFVVHGWSRKESVAPESRVERINVGPGVRGLALGQFTWDRQGRTEIAALTYDGTVHFVEHGDLDTRPFSEAEAAQRTRGNLKLQKGTKQDVESAASWKPARAAGWKDGKQLLGSNLTADLAKPLIQSNLGGRELDTVMLVGQAQSKLELLRPLGPNDPTLSSDQALAVTDNTAKISLDVESTPVAALTLPRKLNGVQDVVLLNSSSTEVNIVPNAPNTTITVDRVDDPAGAGLTAASACTAAGNDCSLRGAFQFANLPQNDNTTISLPANTYILSINGTNAGGCDGNTVGDLGSQPDHVARRCGSRDDDHPANGNRACPRRRPRDVYERAVHDWLDLQLLGRDVCRRPRRYGGRRRCGLRWRRHHRRRAEQFV